jgi:chemotaxis protein methyltransferase CheR
MSAASHVVTPLAGATVSRAEFGKIRSLLYDVAGIKLNDGKEGLVVSRLGKRIRELGLDGFPSYLARVHKDPREMREMIDRLTTNKTSFFREAAHFEFLRSTVLPAWGGRDVRLWSAGCSSGEEPYTLATVLYDHAQGGAPNGRILATDLSHRVLAKAKAGVYTAETMRDVPAATLARHFERQRDAVAAGSDRFAARDHLRTIISFGVLNLMEEWPMRGPFDAIFCRNVMIYFDRETQERLVQRFSRLLSPDGYLFIGHSETLHALSHDLRYVAPAVYAKGKA